MILCTLFLFMFLLKFSLDFSVLLFFIFIYFIFSFSYYPISWLTYNSIIFDEITFFMVYMLFFVMFISYIYSMEFYLYSSSLSISLFFMFICCFFVFSVNSMFFLYFFYEASLLPILFIIIKFGSYPERSLSAFMLLVYTAIFSFPFLFILFYTYSILGTFSFVSSYFLNYLCSDLGTFIIFFAFAVKLPIYGLHFWLPMAHVEAPTFGSMLLAGVLLKLGGVGLLRFSVLFDSACMFYFLLSYFMFFLVYVTLVCCFQADFKRLVAYSSVSHMMAIPILLISFTMLSFKTIVLLMFFHGLSSPVMFMFVGVLYKMFSTRQLVLMRGLSLVSPFMSLLMIFGFLFTMSTPPFPSFFSEVLFMVSCFHLSSFIIFFLLFFAFFSLIYNMNWFSSIIFFSPSYFMFNIYNANISYQSVYPILLSFIFCVPMIFLVSLV